MRFIGLFAATVYLFTTVSQAASAAPLNARVLVVHPPIYPLVVEIMRGSGTPELLLGRGQDNHHFQLSPSQAEKLSKASMIILADRGLSPALNKKLQEAADKGAKIIALTEFPSAHPLPYRTKNRFTKHEESHQGLVDPHLWLDPIRMAGIVGELAASMGASNPASDATYQHNASTLSYHLSEEVDVGIRNLLAAAKPADTKDVLAYITYHDAYQYFEKRYGLSPTGYITQRPEEYIGAQAMKQLMESAREQKVRCIIAESHSPIAKRFALYTQAKIMMLSPERLYDAKDAPSMPWVRNDYDRLLVKTARIFADCISGKTSK